RIDRQTFFDSNPGFIDLMLLFEQNGETNAWINGTWIGRGGLGKASASPFREAHGLILVAYHTHNFSIGRSKFERLLPCAIGEINVTQPRSGVAVFSPDYRNAGILADQLLVSRKGLDKVIRQEELAGFAMLFL